jgi:hypothetical protein
MSRGLRGSAVVAPVGQRFGEWTVVGPVPGSSPARWACRCDCGTEANVLVGNLRRRLTTSCGCSAPRKIGDAFRVHGRRHSPEFNSWVQMRARCRNPKSPAWHDYGGRGIRVCERWSTRFAPFFADMGERPTPEHSIDRADVNGPYCAENCRWATKSEQANNKTNTHRVEVGGELVPLQVLARAAGVHPLTLRGRLNRGWSLEEALTQRTEHPKMGNPHGSAYGRIGATSDLSLIADLVATNDAGPVTERCGCDACETWRSGRLERKAS